MLEPETTRAAYTRVVSARLSSVCLMEVVAIISAPASREFSSPLARPKPAKNDDEQRLKAKEQKHKHKN